MLKIISSDGENNKIPLEILKSSVNLQNLKLQFYSKIAYMFNNRFINNKFFFIILWIQLFALKNEIIILFHLHYNKLNSDSLHNL